MRKPSKSPTEFVDFEIQEIPLEEATQLAATANGKYAMLADQLLLRIKSSPRKGFVFKSPKELPDHERRGICISTSSFLKHAGLPFRVKYSQSRQLFVVFPKNSHISREVVEPKPVDSPFDRMNEIIDRLCRIFSMDKKAIFGNKFNKELVAQRSSLIFILREQGFRTTDIASLFDKYGTDITRFARIAKQRGYKEINLFRNVLTKGDSLALPS